jgi:hypothetical protein
MMKLFVNNILVGNYETITELHAAKDELALYGALRINDRIEIIYNDIIEEEFVFRKEDNRYSFVCE